MEGAHIMDTNFKTLHQHNVYPVPVGGFFGKDPSSCLLMFAPLKNEFFLVTPDEAANMESQATAGHPSETLKRLMDAPLPPQEEVSVDTFCTLHLLLNEKCNFHCGYCYSAAGRSNAELDMKQIEVILRFFLSSERKAPKKRTVMFMGGGEPMLSWNLLKEATLLAESIGQEQGVEVDFSLTTNGSIMNNEMMEFFKTHRFTIQISFEVLPDVQRAQRGPFDQVAANVTNISSKGINHYVRATITKDNVDRIPEMVRYCQEHFPNVKKLSCQQVVDPSYFNDVAVVNDFFDRYFKAFREGVAIGKETGLVVRSSASQSSTFQA